MPAPPEFLDREGFVGRGEIERQADVEHHAEADGQCRHSPRNRNRSGTNRRRRRARPSETRVPTVCRRTDDVGAERIRERNLLRKLTENSARPKQRLRTRGVKTRFSSDLTADRQIAAVIGPAIRMREEEQEEDVAGMRFAGGCAFRATSTRNAIWNVKRRMRSGRWRNSPCDTFVAERRADRIGDEVEIFEIAEDQNVERRVMPIVSRSRVNNGYVRSRGRARNSRRGRGRGRRGPPGLRRCRKTAMRR